MSGYRGRAGHDHRGDPDRWPGPGRFEPIDEGQAFAMLVDYAHTPDSLENVHQAARRLVGEAGHGGHGRVHFVLGCGRDRDRGKRPLMGEIAARLADA